MTGCWTCGGFGNRHDPIAHDAEPLEPFTDDRSDYLRTHEWMGLEDDSPCAACFVTLAACDGPCEESA